jgi:hypothetical protein
MRLRSLILVAALQTAFVPVRADIVTLIDGRTIEGDVVAEAPDSITVKVAIGKTVVKREEIQKIEHTKSARAVIREKFDALAKTKGDADAWLKLAAEAKRAGAQDEAVDAYKKVVEIEIDNETANLALGRVKSGEHWTEKSEPTPKASAKGEGKKSPGNQVTPFETDTSAAMPKDKLAQAAGVQGFAPHNEQTVKCPGCNGTGIAVMLPCLNCNKSGKPGYKKINDHFEVDQRCGGTGQTVGLYCGLCNRSGKVLLSHITPANGGTKAPPNGMKWCPNCNGTGIETFLPCNQCKRSKWPGYMFMGDHLEVCNRCNGAGKTAALDCGVCKKTGVVPAK